MVHLLVSSLLSLFVSAYFVLAIEEDPLSLSNLFQVSTASREAGNCAAYLTKLELFLEETKVLAQAMNDAADNYQDDIVAQKLLSSYFGIEYDYDVGEIADGSLSAWKSFRSTTTRLNSFLTTGNYDRPSEKRPWIFCNGNFGNHFSWDAEAKDGAGNKIILEEDDEDEDEFIPTIYDIYHDSNIIGGTDPYWVEQHMGYVFLPEDSPGNACDYEHEGSKPAGMVVRGNGEITTIHTGDTLYIPSFPDGVVLCPKLLMGDTPWRSSLDKISYVDPENPENADYLLEDAMPEGAMMLHELVHLVTAWRWDKNGGIDMVGDVTYALNEVLWLAAGDYQEDDESFVDSYMATMNAQTYAYFAVSYWYSLQAWGDVKRVSFFSGRPEFADWLG